MVRVERHTVPILDHQDRRDADRVNVVQLVENIDPVRITRLRSQAKDGEVLAYFVPNRACSSS